MERFRCFLSRSRALWEGHDSGRKALATGLVLLPLRDRRPLIGARIAGIPVLQALARVSAIAGRNIH
jgi:hypothetical protein